MAEPLIRIRGVCKTYGKNVVLKNVTLDISSGEIFGLMGASGSGKTTLLSALIGFLPVDEGEVLIRKSETFLSGEAKNKKQKTYYEKPKKVKHLFGFASQSPSFYDKLTVYGNLDYFGKLYGLPKEIRETNIDTLLHLMELKRHQNILSQNLSGGMQRRLDIACALIHDPKILILDEPTADLDPFLRRHIIRLIKKINKKGTTIILSSHNLSEIETLCTRMGVLRGGKLTYVGTPDQLKSQFTHEEQVHIETYPGNYDELIKKIKDDKITKMENKGNELIISTKSAEEVLHKVLHAIEDSKESLIDVRLSKPSLEEVFIHLAKEDRKGVVDQNEDIQSNKKES